MKMEEVIGGAIKIGGTTYNMVEAKYSGVIVWPAGQPVVTTTYEVVASSVYYIFSNGGSYLRASGSNYASAFGTVLVKEDGQTVETLSNTRLNVYLPEGSPFHISNNNIFGDNLGTTLYPNGLSGSVYVSYRTSSTVTAGALVYQEENVVESTSTSQGTPVYDYEHATYSYDYTLAFDANRYDSTSSKCPANGGTATLTLSAYHYVESWIPWTRIDTTTYTYTSQAQDVSTTTVSDTEYSKRRVTDTATITGSATGFSRSNLAVSIDSYLTTSSGWDTGRSVTYTARVQKYDNTYLTETLTIYQDADSIRETIPVTEREWTSQPQTSYSNYSVAMTIANYDYVCSATHPASAGQSFVGFGLSGSHREVVTRDYVDVTTETTYWVSGRTTTGTPSTESGTATISDETIQDTPSLAFAYETGHGSGWLTHDSTNSRLNIASEGTTTYTNASGYGRRGKITATNGTATQEIYVYQARNTRTTEWDYNLAVSINGDDVIPASQTQIGVSYTCQRRSRYTYTSGDSTTWSAYESVTPTIDITPSGCEVQNLTSSAFTVNLGTYTAQVDREITVTISYGTATPVSDSITQSAYVPTTQNVATFKPLFFNVDTGPFTAGKVYYLLTIDSGSVTSSTLTNVYFCYQRGSAIGTSTKTEVICGSITVSETGTNPGTFQPSEQTQGITLSVTGQEIRAWFEVRGSKGNFDVVNADGTTDGHYYETTL